MNTQVLLNIKKDAKMYEYLHNNSRFYRLLNRNALNYQEFVKEYKKYSRNNNYHKINDFIDNIDTIKDIISIME